MGEPRILILEKSSRILSGKLKFLFRDEYKTELQILDEVFILKTLRKHPFSFWAWKISSLIGS